MSATRQLLRFPEVRQRVGLSKSELYRRVRRGEFPQPVPLGQRARAWDSSEVDAWILARIEARRHVHVGGQPQHAQSMRDRHRDDR